MEPASGYRLKASSVAEVSRLIDDFRADAVRLLARGYGRLVAQAAVSAHDLACAGLRERPSDPFGDACRAVRDANPAGGAGLAAPDLNCVLSIHFVHDAVLARFLHGAPQYRKAWEGMRGVVAWGWAEGPRPDGVSERGWESRGRYWKAAAPKAGLGSLRFTLIEGQLPAIGWAGVRRYVPSYEARISAAAAAIEAAQACGAGQARLRAEKALVRDLVKESFFARPSPAPVAAAKAEQAAETGAQRIRSQAAAARRTQKAPKPSREADGSGKAVEIDHADVVVASDGRTFVAVPYVGLDTETRVFLQVGDGYLSVSQGGVQYGHVTDVPRSAVDALRLCRTVTMVEVDGKGGGRLLRARHIAIVSDIGLTEGIKVPLGAFKRNKGGRGAEEIVKWESGQ